jgi:hypothetical protein
LIIVPTSEDSRTIWGGDYHEVEYFTKAYTVTDVLYSKTQFQPNQAIHTPPFTPCPPNLEKIFIKGDTEIVCNGVEDG